MVCPRKKFNRKEKVTNMIFRRNMVKLPKKQVRRTNVFPSGKSRTGLEKMMAIGFHHEDD